ncbi:MaoC/PaaZ C-terminal domain-containing protein [Caenimonas soli]|uniref:MaoC/PaaZ C-terminal domain-containing protein n=1 Tax=Caenimonas soli TaxID=2735555 RepID=UPI0015561CCD|nr:MaoC/PaaZ C-terminal domain-containing protein [Caenimonas soli]NPC55975.1 acyl dehydratase [Caenimonas soli]
MPTFQAGDKMSFRKTLTVAEQAMFTGISGNLAPLYVDLRAAREAGFDAMLAFELNAVALATTALNRLTGPGWRLGGLQIDFSAPLTVGQTVESAVEIISADAHSLACRVRCTVAGGATVAEGTARMVPVRIGS